MSKFKIILVVGDNQATILKLDYSKPSMLIIASMSLFWYRQKTAHSHLQPSPPLFKGHFACKQKNYLRLSPLDVISPCIEMNLIYYDPI